MSCLHYGARCVPHGNLHCVILSQMSYMLKCYESDGDARIEAFIQKAFQWYCKEMKSTEDQGRYLYTLISDDSAEPSGTGRSNKGDMRK